MRIWGYFLAVLSLLALLSPVTASAASLKWRIDNDYHRTVQLEFYSQRRNHVWPGHGNVYVIRPNEGQVSFPLSCRNGEQICYGAWVRGNSRIYWGSGKGDTHRCSDCCAVCGRGDVDGINLVR